MFAVMIFFVLKLFQHIQQIEDRHYKNIREITAEFKEAVNELNSTVKDVHE